MPGAILVIVVGIIIGIYNIYTQCRSDLTQTEKHMVKHGDLYDSLSVLSEKGIFESNDEPEESPARRDIDIINFNKLQVLDNGGWTCLNCDNVNASYVGSCGCGCKKGQKPDKKSNKVYNTEQNKIKVWICSNCGTKNPQTLDECGRCHSMRG